MVSIPFATMVFSAVWIVDPSRWSVPPVLDSSEAFYNHLIVDGNRDV